MIPKKIHYVWGHNEPKSKLAKACISSWAFAMPDFEIIEWNQKTFDFEKLSQECEFFRVAYKCKAWPFISDYIRLKVLYENGGIYLDTDMQIFRDLTPFLESSFFAGFHDGYDPWSKPSKAYVEGSLLGSEKEHPVIEKMIDFFQTEMHKSSLLFFPHILTPILKNDFGLSDENKRVSLKGGIELFPIEYFYPYTSDYQGKLSQTKNETCFAIHWFSNNYTAKHFFHNYYIPLRPFEGKKKWMKAILILVRHAKNSLYRLMR